MSTITINHLKEAENTPFGNNLGISINDALKSKSITLCEKGIQAFEDISLLICRPYTNKNKKDSVRGVRVKMMSGDTYVVLNDCSPSFFECYNQCIKGVLSKLSESEYLIKCKKEADSRALQ